MDSRGMFKSDEHRDEERKVSSKQQLISGIVGFGLIGIYSWVMMAGNGTSGNWAWVILLAAVAVLVTTARSVAANRDSERRGG